MMIYNIIDAAFFFTFEDNLKLKIILILYFSYHKLNGFILKLCTLTRI